MFFFWGKLKNWDAISSLAELLGAAGVIVSLLYLSYQIRENTKTVKAGATKDTYTGWAEYSLHEAGILKTEVWEKHRVYCASFISLPAVSTWWEEEKEQPICSDSFIQEMNSASTHEAITAGSINVRSVAQ